jgi:hypothetical protein
MGNCDYHGSLSSSSIYLEYYNVGIFYMVVVFYHRHSVYSVCSPDNFALPHFILVDYSIHIGISSDRLYSYFTVKS